MAIKSALLKFNLPEFGEYSLVVTSSSRPRILLIENDSDFLGTGANDDGLKGGGLGEITRRVLTDDESKVTTDLKC